MAEHSGELDGMEKSCEMSAERFGVVLADAAYEAVKAENALFRDALERIAIIGDAPEVGATCHWHTEAAAIAKAALTAS